ncbi:NACHT domain-containing protein [Favolaschia claudopus]|uniref:NACHT domain-containing protein n=1 Tax=Favolaschia claudopus TaxID=2862362 RepID=A0AAW0A2J6_9AGAR
MRNINGRLNNFHIQISMLTATGVDKSNADNALLTLYNASAADATHDAGESFTRPPCHPDTQLEILDQLTTWSKDTSDSASPILWMHGPAGTGKSAIAQSFCDKLYSQKTLAGSFFFKRGHPSRGNPTKLWPTIAYQLAQMSTTYKTAITRRLRPDPALLNKSLHDQLQRLLIDPYHDVDTSDGRSLVIVIDGLDECEGDDRQAEILRSLPNLASLPLLRILIVSRPEAHINQVFGEAALFESCRHLTVPGSYEDVELYLTAAFEEIRKDHGIVASWPEKDQIRRILDKSSGHFIYAATVIRFVEDKYCDPDDQLAIVTEVQPSEQNSNFVSPFPALDELYLQILSKVPVQLPLSRVLSVIAAKFNSALSIAEIGQLLGLKHEKISLTIQRLHSLIKIEKRPPPFDAGAEYMSVYHASFLDFLCDRNRSQNFHFSNIDRQNLATNMLKTLSQDSSHSDELHLPQ